MTIEPSFNITEDENNLDFSINSLEVSVFPGGDYDVSITAQIIIGLKLNYRDVSFNFLFDDVCKYKLKMINYYMSHGPGRFKNITMGYPEGYDIPADRVLDISGNVEVGGDVSFNGVGTISVAGNEQDLLRLNIIKSDGSKRSMVIQTPAADDNASAFIFQTGNSFKFMTNATDALVIDAGANITTAKGIAAGKDTETTSFFGKSLVGSWSNSGGSALDDYAIFSHHDRQNEGDFAVMAAAGGTTYLNAKSGAVIRFRINNVNKMTMDSNGNLGINDINPSEKLEVGGNIKCNGNIKIERAGSGGANLTCQATGLNHHGDINIVSVSRANTLGFVGGFNKIRSIGNDNEGALAFIKMNNAGTSIVKTMLKLVQGGAYFDTTVYSAGTTLYSDDRIKENEKLIVNATETLSKLTPQIYDKYRTMDLSGSFQVESGLITQELYYNAPELRHLVHLGKDTDASGNSYTPTPEEMDLSGVDIGSDPDYGSHGWSKTEHSSLNYQGLIPYLIKSNKELVGRIDSLKTDISAIMTHLDLQQLTHK
jgi:hypothetical protein